MALTDLPYAQRAAEIERQRKYAELLQQQAAEPLQSQMVGNRVVPISPWLGLAKMLQAGIGGYYAGKAGKAEAELDTQQRKEAKEQIESYFKGLGPQKVTSQTPVMEQDFGQAATPEDYQNMMNDPNLGLAPKRRDVSQAATPEDVQDIVNQPYEMKDVTSYTPGMSRTQALAKLLEMKAGGNKYLSDATSVLAGALPKAAEEEEYGTPFESGGQMYTMSKSGNVKALDLAAPTKESTYQRTTKEWSDKAGNKYKQDFAFNPTTKSMEPIGEAYLADVYHAPGTSKDDDTKAGATLRSEYNNHPVIKQHAIVSSAYENILNNQETGAGDMALIFQYMKMLDPNSAVREGEYATAENSGSIPQSVRNYYNRAISGERLQPEQRNAFINQAKDIYQTSAQQAATIRQGIEQIGKDTGVNPRLYPLPEPKRRSRGTEELPAGFVPDTTPSQSTFGASQGSSMFQFPSGRAF